jgi:hypothetical protein
LLRSEEWERLWILLKWGFLEIGSRQVNSFHLSEELGVGKALDIIKVGFIEIGWQYVSAVLTLQIL